MSEAQASLGPGRREARERAIALLYEREVRDLAAQEVLDGLPLSPNEYAQQALLGVEAAQIEIDETIGQHLDGWTVARLPVVDRAILRLGTWELIEEEVPSAVVIDEAIELAKEYSTERSSAFVNGVLDAIARTVRAS